MEIFFFFFLFFLGEFCRKRAITHDNIRHDTKHDHTDNTLVSELHNTKERMREADGLWQNVI